MIANLFFVYYYPINLFILRRNSSRFFSIRCSTSCFDILCCLLISISVCFYSKTTYRDRLNEIKNRRISLFKNTQIRYIIEGSEYNNHSNLAFRYIRRILQTLLVILYVYKFNTNSPFFRHKIWRGGVIFD